MNRTKIDVAITHEDHRPENRFTPEALLAQRRQARQPQVLSRFEEAFEFGNSPYDIPELKKAVLSAVYLLEYTTENGNEPLDGYAALGIARMLRTCADNLDRFYTRDDVEALGGDINLLAPTRDAR